MCDRRQQDNGLKENGEAARMTDLPAWLQASDVSTHLSVVRPRRSTAPQRRRRTLTLVTSEMSYITLRQN